MTRAVADPEFKYAGSELELFEKARNWKAYWRAQIAEFVRGEVLEVGAGIGANTLTLAGLDVRALDVPGAGCRARGAHRTAPGRAA